ncbi:GPW/gp25 family protein [Hymenobacter sp. 15J16-1T3B]|uniref:GPW/gp25 family protein n=1 Tax=Hymenobacter sp. 15J16-1T3B TaxID=2886941 RepID=UPI001D125ABC|nr:GPW/gp25 family protein [Hymenobacter sp. 15J16-1T3B]MCC3158600.1 GPW/gp25 family protein [Hymenobacter sp. 15J16-1T3B]
MSESFYRLPLDMAALLERQQLPRCSVQESIAQHLYLILTTQFGESRYDPGYGCQVWEQDFEALTTMRWKDNVQRSVEQAIRTYEPRLVRARAHVSVTDFEVRHVGQRVRKRLEVKVNAVLHRTNEPFAFQASLFVAPLAVD